MRGGCDLSLRTPHHIVVRARVWCRREMIFLREELIAEGFPGGARVRQNYQEGPSPRLKFLRLGSGCRQTSGFKIWQTFPVRDVQCQCLAEVARRSGYQSIGTADCFLQPIRNVSILLGYFALFSSSRIWVTVTPIPQIEIRRTRDTCYRIGLVAVSVLKI